MWFKTLHNIVFYVVNLMCNLGFKIFTQISCKVQYSK